MAIKTLRACCEFVIIAAAPVLAQTSSAPAGPETTVRNGQLGGVSAGGSAATLFSDGGGGASISSVSFVSLEPVTGRPYSAEQVTEHEQTLADGTHIAQTTQKIMLYRDTAGRTRTEHTIMPPFGTINASPPSFIEITDPVAGYCYILNQHNHTAQRIALPLAHRRITNTGSASSSTSTGATRSRQPANTVQAPAGQSHPEMVKESLGTQMIEGLPAEGTRIRVTYPAGFFGNDRPLGP
jgi:hypothetical protein